MDNNGHVLYTKEDFTNEELEAGNQIAEMVIVGGLGICKKCGDGEAGLDEQCRATIKPVTALDHLFNQAVRLGSELQLSPWDGVELYRKFNGGRLPAHPLYSPTEIHLRIKGIKLSGPAIRIAESIK